MKTAVYLFFILMPAGFAIVLSKCTKMRIPDETNKYIDSISEYKPKVHGMISNWSAEKVNNGLTN